MSSFYFLDDFTGYCFSDDGLLKSMNGGETWVKQNKDAIGDNTGGKIFVLNHQDIFLMDIGGKVYYSWNEGKNWIKDLDITGIQINDITSNGEYVFIVTSDGRILRRSREY